MAYTGKPVVVVLEQEDTKAASIIVDDDDEDYIGCEVLTYNKKWYQYDRYDAETGRYYYMQCTTMEVDDKDVIGSLVHG